MAQIDIQRCPLKTSPNDRLNAYNRHALAPWIAETGYLTPAYLYRREKERLPFNMGRWMSQKVAASMLHPPLLGFHLNHEIVTRLLEIAMKCQYSTQLAKAYRADIDHLEDRFPSLIGSETGYFVRLSESSPKDVDDGNLQPVHSVAGALQKLVCSKRAVQALLSIYQSDDRTTDNELYFFPYHAGLDRLSEWRCYIHNSEVVAISQSRFYQPYHEDVSDHALQNMVVQARRLWQEISTELPFTACALDIYAEVHKQDFAVSLIEINPYYPHVGSGSLLFHWLDDADILLAHELRNKTIVRLVSAEGSKTKPLGRKEAYNIGREGIALDEIKVLRERGLHWILEPEHHHKFMALPVPGWRANMYLVTRQARLERFRVALEGGKQSEIADNAPEDHPRFRWVQKEYLRQQEQ
ncbi:hypothetical protein HII31_07743 [Pseudocercospora fuligena]|uniref:Cell division cycle protein 123 n=1 Tax=Pseudocercospora fuligena TaxID=685502 RepID=A0A8H6RFH4_9PEZI|nr:hypothetical protein HII31_07743 [Pseudocercospora fuligena]